MQAMTSLDESVGFDEETQATHLADREHRCNVRNAQDMQPEVVWSILGVHWQKTRTPESSVVR